MKNALLIYVRARVGKNWILEDGDSATHFYKVLGVTARNAEDLTALVHAHLNEIDVGSVLVAIDDMFSADLKKQGIDAEDLCGNPNDYGLWFYSGRCFYNEGDEEAIREWLDGIYARSHMR